MKYKSPVEDSKFLIFMIFFLQKMQQKTNKLDYLFTCIFKTLLANSSMYSVFKMREVVVTIGVYKWTKNKSIY